MLSRSNCGDSKMSEKTSLKVLIVDDEPQIVNLLSDFLSPNYEVISAYSGHEGLEKAENEDPDLILLDVMMPDMDGYEVCKILKSKPSSQFIPVIMVTALSGRKKRIEGIGAGADDFLTKPVDRLELLTRVKSLLRIKQLHDELVDERNKLHMQNRVRAILTKLVPNILNILPFEQQNILIHQNIAVVEDVILEYANDMCLTEDVCVADIVCDFMNQLGGSFSYQKNEDGNGYIVIGTVCPWGADEVRGNPMLCNITRSMFTKVIDTQYDDWSVDTIKTIGNRDDCCRFELNKR